MDKKHLNQKIENLKVDLDLLATVNDSIVDYVGEFPYSEIAKYISNARSELKSEVLSLESQLIG